MKTQERTWLLHSASATLVSVLALLFGRRLIGSGNYWSGGTIALLGLFLVLGLVWKILDIRELKGKSG